MVNNKAVMNVILLKEPETLKNPQKRTEEELSIADRITSPSILTPFELAAHRSDVAFATQALTQLSEEERQIITLHYEQGLSFENAGTRIGIPRSTAQSRHYTGLIKLRRAFERDYNVQATQAVRVAREVSASPATFIADL